MATPFRRALLLVAAVAGAFLSPYPAAGGRSLLAPPAAAAKTTPALAALVAGGYGAFPIERVVLGHRAGDLYYLAELAGPLDAETLRALRGAGARVRHRFGSIGWVALSSPAAAVAAVARLPEVARLEVDSVHQLLAAAAAPVATSTAVPGDQPKRGTGDVGAAVLWAQGITGRGVTVGVADTGIDVGHPDLDDQDWLAWDVPGAQPKLSVFVDCTSAQPERGTGCPEVPAYDDHGHGTHVAGTAAGTAEGGDAGQRGRLAGVAPAAGLAGAKVCLAAASCLSSAIMAGLEHLARERAQGGAGADVVNVSLGSGRTVLPPLLAATQVTNEDPTAKLVNRLAVDHNVLFVVAAGNGGPGLQSVGSPAVAARALAVGAAVADWDLARPVKETEHGVLAPVRPAAAERGASAIAGFSSRGPSGDRLIKPEVIATGAYVVAPEAALGTDVRTFDALTPHAYSSDPLYAVLSGTSMAAPTAAGVAALVIEGYRRATGETPRFDLLKAALANTARTDAFEGSVTGLLSTLRAKLIGDDPAKLRPTRSSDWVGVTGQGSGRVHAPSALLALTSGITLLSAQEGPLDGVHERQPNWAVDALAPGETATRRFVVRGGPHLPASSSVQFGVEAGRVPRGVRAASPAWFRLPAGAVRAQAGAEVPVEVAVHVPPGTPPGQYEATLVGRARLGHAVQILRLPVQLFVPVPVGGRTSGEIWAGEATDYSLVGSLNPLGEIATDWAMFPVRLPAGSAPVTMAADAGSGTDHLDLLVFDGKGQEVDSTVSAALEHAVPGGVLLGPTDAARPATVSILDGDDRVPLELPATVWIVVSNTKPARAPGFSGFNLSVQAGQARGLDLPLRLPV